MRKIFHYALRIKHYELRIAFLFCAAILMMTSTCAAENLKFIDAMDDTGYYYDADSVDFQSDDVFSVRMAVIKAGLNRMYTYDVLITAADRTYEILSTKILSYDTRAVLETNDNRRPPQRYSTRSEFGQMVHLILYGN